MGNQQVNVDASPEAVTRAQDMWVNFTVLARYGIIAVIVALIGLAWIGL